MFIVARYLLLKTKVLGGFSMDLLCSIKGSNSLQTFAFETLLLFPEWSKKSWSAEFYLTGALLLGWIFRSLFSVGGNVLSPKGPTLGKGCQLNQNVPATFPYIYSMGICSMWLLMQTPRSPQQSCCIHTVLRAQFSLWITSWVCSLSCFGLVNKY